MDVRARALRLPTPALRYDAAHVHSDRAGVSSALRVAAQVPSKTRSVKRRLCVSICCFFPFPSAFRFSARVSGLVEYPTRRELTDPNRYDTKSRVCIP
jgi:hypothetical protein